MRKLSINFTLVSALITSSAVAQVATQDSNSPITPASPPSQVAAPAPAAVEEPVVEDLAAEEPVVQEPVVQEPVAQESAQTATTLPTGTILPVTNSDVITSIDMKEGDSYILQVAMDIAHNGVVVIPRGSPVKTSITWRTGKGIGGKSAKFELSFNSVTVQGQEYLLNGKHRQEGKGNTVGAMLGFMVISGRSAIIPAGQTLSASTAEPITVN